MISMYSKYCTVIIVLCLESILGISDKSFIATEIGKTGALQFTANTTGAVTWGTFENEINKTGWSYLEVYSNETFPDITQAYAAGLVEGYLSKKLLQFQLYNNHDDLCPLPLSAFCVKLKDYLNVNLQWMYSQIAEHANNGSYWHHVSLFLAQVKGIRDGYHNKIDKPSYEFDNPIDPFILLQISGDIEDLSTVLGGASTKILGSGSCSALIKLLPGNMDLFTSQDTWGVFNTMLRILKKYDLKYHVTDNANSELIPGDIMTFSSYPGSVTSGDDFYVISSKLVSQETTIGNSNSDLWQYVTPTNSVLEGIRSMVANRLARTGQQWADIFKSYNSGTYNNQWMIVDYNKFTPGQTLKDGTLWVIEQIPKYVVASDQTEVLRKQAYWPSYNIAYYPEIFNMSGQPVSVAKYGDWFTYEHNPRANIFRRDQSSVKDMPTMIKLMRYNDFQHDPLSTCNCTPPYSGENTISARSDLNPVNGTYAFGALGHRAHGGTDMKVTNTGMVESLEFISQLGPAFDNVPAFQWSTSDYNTKLRHAGLPDKYTFKPIQHKWGTR